MSPVITGANIADIIKTAIAPMLQTDMNVFIGAGNSLLLSFATITIVIVGIKMALAREGINWTAFIQPIFLIATTLAIFRAYNTPMPWLKDQSVLDLITGGPAYFADQINDNTWKNLQDLFTKYDIAHTGSAWNSIVSIFTDPGNAIAGILVAFLTELLKAAMLLIMAWGYIAQTVCAIVGPLFIPFLLIKPLSFIFWGWFRCILTYSFYPVVATLVVSIISSITLACMTAFPNPGGVMSNIYGTAACIPFLFFGVLALFGTPSLVNSLFSGHASDAGVAGHTLTALRMAR